MLRLIHAILVGLYLILPVAAVGLATWERRRGNRTPLAGLAVTAVVAFLISLTINVIYSNPWGIAATGVGRISLAQIAIGTYFAAGLLLFLKLFDFGIRAGLRRALGIKPVL